MKQHNEHTGFCCEMNNFLNISTIPSTNQCKSGKHPVHRSFEVDGNTNRPGRKSSSTAVQFTETAKGAESMRVGVLFKTSMVVVDIDLSAWRSHPSALKHPAFFRIKRRSSFGGPVVPSLPWDLYLICYQRHAGCDLLRVSTSQLFTSLTAHPLGTLNPPALWR